MFQPPAPFGGYSGTAPPPKKWTKTYGQTEPAIKHVYNWRNCTWAKHEIEVQLDDQPFQEGTLRVIFYLKDLSLPPNQQECVAKLSKDPLEGPQSYFLDVEMQGKAKAYADMFNARMPPKKIDFVVPSVIEFKRRTSRSGIGRLYMGVEPMLPGEYKKHSNNFGFVSDEDRNTPAAFSHFTYHCSGGKLLVCDIQGVEDTYTDPQIHSADGSQRWGKADMGYDGIRQFFGTHHCNAICEFLKLPVYGQKKPCDLTTALSGGKKVLGNNNQHNIINSSPFM
eukprot:NODE_240_length_1109_cov_678.848269_g229_i1.p1 GENE.NODE_240_length_1109_cov_678.848269_g229_i1~~NODE_240_length_1109_cov_678.848269_g229_i1.p1  ORF type:complete len:280 (+),score=65.22 NODE_240_length_1109_cov_678.848269_g229_i1:77-916(+)